MLNFSIGEEETQLLTVRVLGRSHPGANDYWDGNWVNVIVEIAAGGFRGSFAAYFRAEDFLELCQGLTQLHSSLCGLHSFETMEQQLAFEVRGNGRGHFEVKGIAIDRAGDGNQLHFSFDVEQTFIRGTLRELEQIIEQFPVKGSLTSS